MRNFIWGLILLFVVVYSGVAHATTFRTENKRLTISGAVIDATVIPANTTVTSDSVYQKGNLGFQTIATKVRGTNASVTTTYQVSNDNSNWWTPYTTTATSGTLTANGTISTSQTADRWVVMPGVIAPYIRFNFAQGSGGSATITADTLWQVAD